MTSLFRGLLVVALGIGSAGCGALSALSNPKALWAFDEPAPMSVVVRRAEVAHATAAEVERLMTETGVDEGSEWIPKTAMKTADAKVLLTDVGSDDTYANVKGAKLRVVPAEAWVVTFSRICSEESEHPSLLAATSPAMAEGYEKLATQQRGIAKLKAERAAKELELEAKGLSEAGKEAIEKRCDELDETIDKAQDAYEPMAEAFIAKVREEASKADPDTKKRLGVVLVNLRRAVEDARMNNSVALIRYPMAVTSLPDDVQTSAKRVVADVIEEHTGKRPDMTTLKPEVTLDGTNVGLKLNGLSPSDLADLSPDEVVEETTLRLGGYVVRVLTLIAFVSETQEKLAFQADVLDAWIEGFQLDPTKVEGAGDDLADLNVETTGAGKSPKSAEAAAPSRAKHTPGGLRSVTCDAAPEPAAPEPPVEVATKPAGKSGKQPQAKPKVNTSGGRPVVSTGGPTAKPAAGPAPATGPATSAPAATAPAATAPAEPAEEPCIIVTNAAGSRCL